MNERNASDLYLTVGHPPALRIENDLSVIRESALSAEEIQDILNSVLTTKQMRDFEANWELNTSLDLGQHGRFRLNVMKQRQHPGLVIRRIVSKIPSFAELKLPSILESLALERRGLVLVTGMTGSGKSTTLAAMVDYRNIREEGHIITIEDPIEYFHEHQKSIVTQREVGVDTESYAVAMKNALRQRPDVILVGEIRDRDVMEQALTISETGHLCLATLHTTNAYQAIERVVNLFSEDAQKQVRLNLSQNLKAIVAQRLLPSVSGNLVPALEIMINEGLIRDIIYKGEYDKILGVMEQSNRSGMCTFDQSILQLYKDGEIAEETAIMHADKATDMKVKIQALKMGEEGEDLKHLDTSLLSMSD